MLGIASEPLAEADVTRTINQSMILIVRHIAAATNPMIIDLRLGLKNYLKRGYWLAIHSQTQLRQLHQQRKPM